MKLLHVPCWSTQWCWRACIWYSANVWSMKELQRCREVAQCFACWSKFGLKRYKCIILFVFQNISLKFIVIAGVTYCFLEVGGSYFLKRYEIISTNWNRNKRNLKSSSTKSGGFPNHSHTLWNWHQMVCTRISHLPHNQSSWSWFWQVFRRNANNLHVWMASWSCGDAWRRHNLQFPTRPCWLQAVFLPSSFDVFDGSLLPSMPMNDDDLLVRCNSQRVAGFVAPVFSPKQWSSWFYLETYRWNCAGHSVAGEGGKRRCWLLDYLENNDFTARHHVTWETPLGLWQCDIMWHGKLHWGSMNLFDLGISQLPYKTTSFSILIFTKH